MTTTTLVNTAKRPLKVTFITPVSDILRHTIPWNLLTLAAVIREEGFVPRIIDLKTEHGPAHAYEILFRELAKDVPDVVGLACSTADVLDARRIAGQIKQLYPHVIVVVGGIHVTIRPGDFFDQEYGIDYAVTGYGEIPFTRLLNALAVDDVEKARTVPNTGFRGPSGFAQTPETNEPYDLAKLPPMDFELLDMKYYTRPAEDIIRGIPLAGVTIYTTIGCPYKCSFCVSGGLWEIVSRVRYKEVKYVVDELEFLKNRYHIEGFFIYDDVFVLNKKYVREVCEEMMRRKLNLIWGCLSTVHVIDREIAAVMSKAGCVHMDFGVESGSAGSLERMNKSWAKLDKTRETFKICEEFGIRTLANWMFNSPDETEEDVEATLSFAKEVKANTNVFNFFVPWPGGADGDRYWEAHKDDIDLQDFEKLVRGGSWRSHLETVDRKFRQAKHSISFVDLFARIVKDFPARANFRFKFSWQWMRQFNRLISWVYTPWFWKLVLTSRRKKEYLRWLLSALWRLLPQWRVTFDNKMNLHLSSVLKPPSGPGQSVRLE